MCGTLWHILASGIPGAGHFTLHVHESSVCYRPNVRKVTPGSYALNHLVNQNLPTHFHTYPRSTCKVRLDSGAPAVIPPENGGLWAPAGLPP